MKPLTLSLIQADLAWEDKIKNLSFFQNEITALPREAQVVLLPEMFNTGFSMNATLAEDMEGETLQWLKATAHKAGKILAGSLMIKEAGKIFNRLIWMLPDGTWYHYDKRHLFAFGGEEKVFSPGEKRLVVQVNGWKICLLVCYDLRFPVWSRQQAEPFDLLIYVANWPEKRSHAWNTLLQARAIENQCFVAGLNRVAEDGNGIYHSGDSALIDPLGRIMDQVSGGPGTLTQTLHKRPLEEVRSHFPFLKDADKFLIL
jgi:predicted amidohydrolase